MKKEQKNYINIPNFLGSYYDYSQVGVDVLTKLHGTSQEHKVTGGGRPIH